MAVLQIETTRRALRKRFQHLATAWRARKSHSSCVEDMAMDSSYQQIIGLGPSAVPLILEELEDRPEHWFWALHAITGANPVPARSRGKIRAMASAWLRWGKKQGYKW